VLSVVAGGALGSWVGLSLGLLVLVAGGGVLPPDVSSPLELPPLPPSSVPVAGVWVLLGVDDEPEPDEVSDEPGDGSAVGGGDWMAAVRSACTLAIAARMTAARSLVIAPLAVLACTAVLNASKRDRA
jgi:hypothetical protein